MNTPNTEMTPQTGSGSARRRVLVLESDRLIRALIVEWLGMSGNEALCVADLADAKTQAKACDLVLADVPAPSSRGPSHGDAARAGHSPRAHYRDVG